jgi:hypothetical protein
MTKEMLSGCEQVLDEMVKVQKKMVRRRKANGKTRKRKNVPKLSVVNFGTFVWMMELAALGSKKH